MSIIQQHTSASLGDAWRTINIDALEEDSSLNFDTSTLHPPQPEISESEVRQLSGQVRQLLRGGDAEGALRGCLEFPVYNGPDLAKVCLARVARLQDRNLSHTIYQYRMRICRQ
jgi:actin related protein 2/3 complex, subunit 5